MYISAVSVGISLITSLTFRKVDSDEPINVEKPMKFVRSVYKSNKFWIKTMWWVVYFGA